MSDPHKINPEVMDLPPPYPVDFRPASGLESPTSMDGFATPIVDFTDQMPEGRLVINASSPVAIENSVQGTSGLNGMELKQESATQFRLYSKRWFMLLIYGIDVSIGNMNSIAVADRIGRHRGRVPGHRGLRGQLVQHDEQRGPPAPDRPGPRPLRREVGNPIHFLLRRRPPVTRLLY